MSEQDAAARKADFSVDDMIEVLLACGWEARCDAQHDNIKRWWAERMGEEEGDNDNGGGGVKSANCPRQRAVKASGDAGSSPAHPTKHERSQLRRRMTWIGSN